MSLAHARSFAGAAREHGAAALTIAAAALLLCAYGSHVAAAGPASASSHDFSSNYTGATIIRDGRAAQVYDWGLQQSVATPLMAPYRLTLPFDQVALGATALVPLTFLPLPGAFVVWIALQFLLVLSAVVIAVRAAPGAKGRTLMAGAAIAGIALTTVGLDSLIGVGQSTGVNAFGLAMACRCWRRGSDAAGGAWLAGSIALFKPHLGLGLAAFLLAWGNRRALLGALVAGGASLAALLVVVSPAGVLAMLSDGALVRYSQLGGASFMALPTMWFGDGALSFAAGIAGGCIGVLLCALLGRRVRRGRSAMGPALAAAAALSLLAAPHAFLYDTVMLAPAVAWSLAELGLFTSPQPRTLDGAWAIVVLWAVAPWIQRVFATQLTPLVAQIGVPDVWFSLVLAVVLWSNIAKTKAALGAPALGPPLPAGQ